MPGLIIDRETSHFLVQVVPSTAVMATSDTNGTSAGTLPQSVNLAATAGIRVLACLAAILCNIL
jgi:hypothetical protein